jgi:MFS family permease
MPRVQSGPLPRNYKWTALSNTTLGMFMATLDASIVLISLPAIFRGINLDPLTPSNIGYLLWMLMGYLVVTAVLVVTFGRLGDMFGRVRMYNAGFAVFTAASIALSLTPGTGAPGSSPEGCWPTSTCSGSMCRSVCSAPSGRTPSCASSVSRSARRSTGGATSPSRSA